MLKLVLVLEASLLEEGPVELRHKEWGETGPGEPRLACHHQCHRAHCELCPKSLYLFGFYLLQGLELVSR